jgi:hypothetical protein
MARPKTLGPKLFTLQEAEALLPLVNDRLARGQELLNRFEAVRKDLAVLRLVGASGGDSKNPDRTALSRKESEEAALVSEIRRVETDLLECGCVPKSVGEGLVDFFALKEGRLVFLCWKQGEEHIEAWHTVEGGFAGRMPIASFLRGRATSE